MAAKDYYKTLGVDRTATDKDIKKAYRRLARKYHPDVNPTDKAAETRFKEINEAYEVIYDPQKRKKYDQYGDQWKHADQFAKSGGPFGGFKQGNTVFEFNDSGGGDINDILSSMFGGSRGHSGARSRPVRRQAAQVPVTISLEEAFAGTARLIDVEGRRLEVKIPAGVDSGSKVRVATGKQSHSGDIHLVISVKAHHQFERKADTLHVNVSVQLTDAMLGGEVEVPTLKGKLALKIPPETQNGKTFRLKNQGMPHLTNETRGDLIAKIQVVLPTNLTGKQKELIEEFKSLSK